MHNSIPILKCLTIQSAPSKRNRGNQTAVHRAMKVWIARNLERYGPITPNHVFHVSALGKEYAVRRDDLGANLWYRPIARLKWTQHKYIDVKGELGKEGLYIEETWRWRCRESTKS